MVAFSLLAFGFGSPLLLGWLGVAAAPIILHLLNRRHYREIPWAAMEYLLAALKKNQRRLQLQQWLLLAMRTLMVILVVTALARPLIDQFSLAGPTLAKTLTVLVVDTSYSMDLRQQDTTCLEQGKKLARSLVQQSPPGSTFELIQMGTPPAVVVKEPSADAPSVIQEIDALGLSESGADAVAALRLASGLLEQAQAQGHEQAQIVFLTDLASNTWQAVAEQTDLVETVRHQLNGNVAVRVCDLGQPPQENLVLTDCELANPLVTTASAAEFVVGVKHYGSQSQTARLQLLIAGQPIEEQKVAVPIGGTAQARFVHQFDQPGNYGIEIRLADDALLPDNHRFLSVQVRDSLQVLCVEGKQGSRLQGGADYVRLALQPDPEGGNRWIEPHVIPDSGLLERSLQSEDVVFLCNVRQFTAAEAALLERFVTEGGGLVIFLGAQANLARYAEQLLDGPVRLLPMRPDAVVNRGEKSCHFDPLGYQHPLLKVFAGHEDAGLLNVLTRSYVHLQPLPDTPAQVVARFDNGDPAIVEAAHGQGRVILIATEGSLASRDEQSGATWTTLPVSPCFLPLVQEVVKRVMLPQRGGRNVMVGEPLQDHWAGLAQELRLNSPLGPRPVTLASDEQGQQWRFTETERSGLYQLDADAGAGPSAVFAVNLDPVESDPARVDPKGLPSGVQIQKDWDATNRFETEAAVSGSGTSVHRPLLIAVLVLLLAETYLARRMGSDQ